MSSLTINSAVVDSLVLSPRSSRAIWLDVEPEGESFALVLRGRDTELAGNKPSQAVEGRHRQAQKPKLCWNDEAAETRRFILATFPDKASADTAQAQLVDFYLSSDDPIMTFTVRMGALGDDAKAIVPILIACFGPVATGQHRSSSTSIGSYADHLAGKEPKTKKPTIGKRDLAALQKLAALVNNKDALAQLLASVPQPAPTQQTESAPPADLQSQLTGLLAQLSALQSAAQ